MRAFRTQYVRRLLSLTAGLVFWGMGSSRAAEASVDASSLLVAWRTTPVVRDVVPMVVAPPEATSTLPVGWVPTHLRLVHTPDEQGLQLAARVTHTVAPGDTLSSIASRYRVSVRDIQRWNSLRSDRIVIGQRLTIQTSSGAGSQERTQHVVRSGETGVGIARQYRVSLDQLRRWNPDVNLDRLRIGQRLTVYTSTRGGGSGSASSTPSGAVGTATNGRLIDGVQLSPGAGLSIRNPDRSYGMQVTIDALRTGYGRMAAHFADETQALVGDVSLKEGGRMTPHRSHQNGLDVDVAIFSLSCIGTICPMQVVSAEDLDTVRQWYVFEEWLRMGIVEFIFLDYSLQQPLYVYAKERGASDAELLRWFQYPRGRSASAGVIRHESGHANHYHVRFRDQG